MDTKWLTVITRLAPAVVFICLHVLQVLPSSNAVFHPAISINYPWEATHTSPSYFIEVNLNLWRGKISCFEKTDLRVDGAYRTHIILWSYLSFYAHCEQAVLVSYIRHSFTPSCGFWNQLRWNRIIRLQLQMFLKKYRLWFFFFLLLFHLADYAVWLLK